MYGGLLSVVDVAPTLLGLMRRRAVTTGAVAAAAAEALPFDGMDVWGAIMSGGESPRARVPTLLALDPVTRSVVRGSRELERE